LDYSNIIDQIIINAKKNKVTPISMHWANGGHKVVALGWQKTGYSDGVIPIYQVNNNSVEEYIKYYKEYSSILRKNITKMTYTSPKGKTIVQYSIKQEVSSQDIVTTISRFATEGTCTSPLNWPKIYGGQSAEYAEGVQQTSDGGYIFAGNISYGDGKANVYLVKTDASGNELWSKTFRERNANYGKSIKQISDGGYIIAGYTGSDLNGGSYFDVYLVKTDSNGNMLWSRTFGGTNNEFGLSVQQTSDGGYIIVGSSGQFVSPGGDVYVIKTDSNGYMLWSKTLGGTNHDAAYSVQQTSDGGYIIAGWTLTSGWSGLNAYLVKTDPNGDMLWSKTFVGTSQAAANSVQQTSDGGYIIAGYTYSTSGTDEGDAYLVKTDKNGDMLWSKTFGGAGWDSARAVLQTPDAGYIIVGYTSSFGVPGGDVYLVKTDSNGNMLWSKISGIVRNYPFSGDIQQTSDGGYIIAGSTSSETNWQDAYLIKTDSNGNIQ
jgi:arginine repressor